MIRCTIELVPGGDSSRARTIGLIEIAKTYTAPGNLASYAVVLKKCPPFNGALIQAWRKSTIVGVTVSPGSDHVDGVATGEDDDIIVAGVEGHHRTKRGVYDLLYRALKACGLEGRLP